MKGFFIMATIAEIQASLLDTSMRGDFSTMTTILNGLTLEQKSQITVFGMVLENVANHSGLDPSGVAAAARTVMSKAGTYIDGTSIGHALVTLSQNSNFNAVDGITDNLVSDYSKGSIPANLLGMTLENLTRAWPMDPIGTAAAVRDFASKLLGSRPIN
jgi:hypothetical protein